ncbi:MAG: nuclear transport factor 2 family protein [Gemmatimonadota bacterium]
MLPSRLAAAPPVALLVCLLACGSPPPGDTEAESGAASASEAARDRAAIRSLLDDFLARADEASAHARFWAEDLVYTSSDGTRRDKATIMAGFDASGDSPEAPEDAVSPEESEPTYSAEDVDIRLYGTTAVVPFRLVITPPAASGEAPSYNLNTGTFLKRDGEWRVVAWQSTRGAR